MSSSRLKNVHLDLPTPGPPDMVSLVKGDYEYWHYCCDGCDDRGWGCGYRTLQTLCSWIKLQRQQQDPSAAHAQQLPCEDPVTAPCRNFIRRHDGVSVAGSSDISSCSGDVINVIKSGDVSGGDFISVIESGDISSGDVNSVAESDDVSTKGTNYQPNIGITSPDSKGNMSGITVVSCGDQTDLSDVGFQKSEYGNELARPLLKVNSQVVRDVPSLREIQQALVTMGDKPGSFAGSRQWIGSYEVCLCLDVFYDVPCKIVHINQGSELKKELLTLKTHFSKIGSPIMMGGDSDASSKGIMGVCTDPAALLVVDPHCSGNARSARSLHNAGWIKWQRLEDFHQTSFYNLCLPQLTSKLLL